MPTLEEHKIRLQLFMCCLASKGNIISSQLRIGNASCCDITTFELLNTYWQTLVCYNPTTVNCLTQEQVDKIWEKVACLCGICFIPYGTTIPTPDAQKLAAENLDELMTEDNNNLII